VYNCPDCNRPLRLIYSKPNHPREYACDIAIQGKLTGKIGPGYKHQDAWVYVENKKVALAAKY
jgi:hypothetical protein